MTLRNIAYFFIVAISLVVVLSFGQSLLIPFVFALLLWFIVREIKNFMNRVDFIKKKFPSWLKTVITSLFIFTILGFVSRVVLFNINTLSKSYKKYQSNVDLLINKINESLNVDLIGMIKGHWGDFDFGAILTLIFNSLTDILSSTFMIIIYALFIFLEEAHFQPKLKSIFSENNQYTKISGVLEQIEISIAKYLGLKTLVSLITGFLSYLVLMLIGIDSPVFWAFLIFLLNFIPTIGSLIATLFPAMFCLLQFGEFSQGVLVLIFVGTIQVMVGNILEPRLMGNSMNISSLVTIISLSFWGAVWGVTGMILSIPITVIIVIILSQFPATKPVAIMLSEKGKIK